MSYDSKCKCGKECYSYVGKCWNCKEQERIAEVEKYAKEQGETWGEKYICCPHCGEHYGEDDINESSDLTCDECNKQFHVEVEYDVSYSTEKL